MAAAYLPHIGLLLGDYALVAAQGTYTVSGQNATLTYSASGGVASTPAPLPHLGLLGGIGGAAGVSDQGSYSITGQAVAFLRGLRVVADAGFYNLSGQPAILNVSVNQGGNPAPLPHLGLVLQSTTGAFTLTADTGIYSITGSEGLADFEMSSAQGTYGFSGQDAALLKTHILVADAGAYAISGQDAVFSIGSPSRVMAADFGTYSISGNNAGLFSGRYVAAEQGFYALQGQAANLVYGVANSYTLIAETGNYAVTGHDAALTFGGYVLQADFGTYRIDGQPVLSTDQTAPSGPFYKKFRRKYAMWVGGKKYLGTQEDFERLVAASFSGTNPKDMPPLSVKLDDRFEKQAAELERQLESVLKEIQRKAYKARQERELLEFL